MARQRGRKEIIRRKSFSRCANLLGSSYRDGVGDHFDIAELDQTFLFGGLKCQSDGYHHLPPAYKEPCLGVALVWLRCGQSFQKFHNSQSVLSLSPPPPP